MAQFSYTARTKSGATQQGLLTATDRSAALSSLSKQNLTPILVKEQVAGRGLNMSLSLGNSKKVSLKERVIFSRQLATMINAGVPIVQALSILKEQSESKALKDALADVTKRVEGGSSFADALALHQDVFSPIYVNMVRAGETGGILDEVLDRLATQQEKDDEVVSKVRGAMIYPGVIMTVTVVAFFFIMTVIVPKLGNVFSQFGTTLPIYTRVMLAISRFMTHEWYILLAIIATIVVVFLRWHATTGGKRTVDRLIVKSPIVGPIIIKVNVARFARTFGSLLASGIAVMDALAATKTALGNTVFQDAITKVSVAVKNGKSISQPLKESGVFPPIVAEMAAVGEETGKMDEILVKIAEFYEREVDAVVAGLASVIEPILIIALGVMVGLIVISVFGPISQLNNSV